MHSEKDSASSGPLERLVRRLPAHHELKCWPEPFLAIRDGRKRHEVRVWDRDFQEGDFVALKEWDPRTESFTGRWHTARIRYVTRPGEWGLPSGIGVFTFKLAA